MSNLKTLVITTNTLTGACIRQMCLESGCAKGSLSLQRHPGAACRREHVKNLTPRQTIKPCNLHFVLRAVWYSRGSHSCIRLYRCFSQLKHQWFNSIAASS